MVKCVDCFHADRNPKTGERTVFEEADMFAKIKPGTEPPKVRVVKSCGEGAGYWQTFGGGEHTCRKFEDASERELQEREELAERTADFHLETSRKKLPVTTNALALIEKMTEGDNDAYGILLEAMVFGFPYLSRLITNLNDMNIRGSQITLAYTWSDAGMATLSQAAEERSSNMVEYVNQKDNGDKGEAVERYAATLAHKDNEDAGNNVAKVRAAPRVRLKLRKGKRKASFD